MSAKRILVFPSVNVEFYQYPEKDSCPENYAKRILRDYHVTIGGSSLNISMALKSGGFDPTLFGFVADEDNGIPELLMHHLNKLPITTRIFPLLKKTNIAFIEKSEDDIIKGFKSLPVDNHVDYREDLKNLEGQYDWKIASGVEAQDIDTVLSLFSENGINLIVPKITLINSRLFRPVLNQVNIVSIDNNEYKKSGLSAEEFGVNLLTVTNEGEEGFFCFNGETRSFKPKKHENNIHTHKTGAGDWFTGALVAFLQRAGISIEDKNTPIEKISEIVNLAAQVATDKITYKGAINGPKY